MAKEIIQTYITTYTIELTDEEVTVIVRSLNTFSTLDAPQELNKIKTNLQEFFRRLTAL